jgi:DNA-binding MarR family transcriptional regulator
MLARMIDRETARELQTEFGMTVADWRVLALTCTLGSSNGSEICAAFETDRAEVSRAVARLIEAGLVRRERDTSHRQKMHIIPTDSGKHIFERARAMRDTYFAAIFQDLTPEQREAFDQALRSIALRVDEMRSTKPSDDPSD